MQKFSQFPNIATWPYYFSIEEEECVCKRYFDLLRQARHRPQINGNCALDFQTSSCFAGFYFIIFFFTHDSFAHSEMSWLVFGLIMEDNGCFFVNSHIGILAALASMFGALSGEGVGLWMGGTLAQCRLVGYFLCCTWRKFNCLVKFGGDL